MHGYFLLRRGDTGKFSFDLRDANHETLLSSFPHASKEAVVDTIASVQRYARDDSRFERVREGEGGSYFLLKAGNAEAIGRSGAFATPAAMEHGIACVKAYAGVTEVRDLA